MKNDIKISVIIPSYKSIKTIEKCLNSLLNQDFNIKDYEIIVVDNSSMDGTVELIRKFPPVRLITVKNTYPSEARNTGARNASGNIIAFIDSDCIAEPDWLESINRNMVDCDGVGGQIINHYRDSLVAWAEYFIEFSEFNDKKGRRKVRNICSANASYRKDFFLEVGGFPGIRAAEEVALNQKLIEKGYQIIFDPAIKVEHMNRTKLLLMLKNQIVLGRGFYVSRKSFEKLPGSILIRFPILLITIPFIRIIRRAKLAREAKKFGLFVITMPIIFMGLVAYTTGAIQKYFEKSGQS